MKKARLFCILFAVTVVGGPMLEASAQSPVAGLGAGDAVDQKKRLIEQKIRLLETLLNSPAAKNAAYGTEAESPSLVAHGQRMIVQARQEMAGGHYDEAGKMLDEAMKAVGRATRRQASESSFAESAQRKTYADQSEQVATYRLSVIDLGRDPKMGEAARVLLGKVDVLNADALQLSSAGRWGEANKKLAEAYKLVTEDIARLRQGQEVVMSLKFESPVEEFLYEEKRFGSNQIMVDMLVAEGKAEGDRRKLIDPFLGEAARIKREADALAQGGRHRDAVKLMERANSQLVRALQLMGVPVF